MGTKLLKLCEETNDSSIADQLIKCLDAASLQWWEETMLKPGSAPGYDNIHPEFLIHLGPKALLRLSIFFSKVITDHRLPKVWRKAKVIDISKPG